MVPLCAVGSPVLGRTRKGQRWYGRLLLGFGLVGAVAVPLAQVAEKGGSAQFTAMSQAIAHELRGRCLYVYEGDSALYRTTRACIPTRFAYPSHLNALNEASAIGIDPATEVRRILATRPAVIVTAASRRPNSANPQTRAIVRAALERDYERYAQPQLGQRKFALWKLRKGH